MGKKSARRATDEALRRIAEAEESSLIFLDLSHLGLSRLPSEIGSLTALQVLDLSQNQLTTLPPEFAALTELQTLDLRKNQLTTLPPEIGSLTALQTLCVSDNKLTTLPSEIKSLTALQTLQLALNQLTTLPPEIGSLMALQTLELGGNQLKMLPPEIGSLTTLQTLQLQTNQLTTLPPEIGSLTALQTLHLRGNRLTTLPPEIGSLTVLQVLGLGQNKLKTLPSEIGMLTALQSLHLALNPLTTLPPEIGLLTTLQTLELPGNQLTTLPPEIGSLTALQSLDLRENRLCALPSQLANLTSLKELYLHDNPDIGVPLEVLGPVSAGGRAQDIITYYFRVAASSRSLREVKLILVGRGEVGKTTLAEALQGKPFEKNRPPTDGISITPWHVKLTDGDAVIRIWDFGGQQIMHGTHQFFLTRRAIYVVMVDGRDDRYQREAEYWLKLVRAFGGDSVVMVVMNRQQSYKFDLDRNALASKYRVPTDLFFPTECSREATISSVRETIFNVVTEILSTHANFPSNWFEVKTELERMTHDYLSADAYRTLCDARGITDAKEQDELLDRLNDLGTIVHFADHDALSELKVLRPDWATDGVYRVVTDAKLREEKGGKLKASALKQILPKDRWPEAAHRRYIIDLMLRFDLCFAAEGEDGTYIVPELLPEMTPELSGWEAKGSVVFRYAYPVLPHGILPRFISKTHSLSEGQHRWRSGVVVATKDGAEALVRADYDANTIDIWVRGQYRDAREALLTVIRARFDEIHCRFTDLQASEMVGVPRDPSVFVSYRDMILDERDGKRTVRVTIGGERVDERLDDILSGVESQAERMKAADRATGYGDFKPPLIVHGNYYEKVTHMRDIKVRTNYGQVSETMRNCSNIVQQQAPGEKRDLLDQLQREVKQLIEQLPDDKAEKIPEVADDLKMLVDQAASDKPNRRWYSMSAQGLLEASKWTKEFSGNILGTVGQLGKLIWPDFKLPSAD